MKKQILFSMFITVFALGHALPAFAIGPDSSALVDSTIPKVKRMTEKEVDELYMKKWQ